MSSEGWWRNVLSDTYSTMVCHSKTSQFVSSVSDFFTETKRPHYYQYNNPSIIVRLHDQGASTCICTGA